MEQKRKLPLIINISEKESIKFDSLIKQYRTKHIRPSSGILNYILSENPGTLKSIKIDKNVSDVIFELREKVWMEYLKDEVKFNAILMRDLYKLLDTPKEIIDILVDETFLETNRDNLVDAVKAVCGEYSGHIFPYIYKLSLSNTQSRRSRAGKTFEAIIYKIYEELDYPYDSQNKVGRKIFDNVVEFLTLPAHMVEQH